MNEISLQNGKKIWLKTLSVRRFELKTNHANIRILKDNNGNFKEIQFSDLFSLKRGDIVNVKDKFGVYINYTLNEVSYISRGVYDCVEEPINKSTIFILPLLGNNHVYFDYSYSLYNAQVSEDYKFIYLKYKFTKSNTYLDLEQKLQTHPLYQDFFDIDSEYVVFKFKLPEKALIDIKCIIEGKYSKINESSKTRILAFHGMTENSKLGYILSKNKNYKKKLEHTLKVKIPSDIDLMSKGLKSKEIWNYQKILH